MPPMGKNAKKAIQKKNHFSKKKKRVEKPRAIASSEESDQDEGVEFERSGKRRPIELIPEMEMDDEEEAEESVAGDDESDLEQAQELTPSDDDLPKSSVDDEEPEEDPEKKQRKSGVLYFPFIPPRFTPKRIKEYFEKRAAPGMIGRVFLARNKHSRNIENRFTEGWLEIKSKKLARAIANSVDNTPVGGKKCDYVSSLLWNIKYLKGFKWVHLTEQLEYEKAVQNKRMAAEVSQARRVAAHFEEQVEKGERLKKLEEKVLKQSGKWDEFKRQVKQKKTLKKKKQSKAKDDEVMQMIFAE